MSFGSQYSPNKLITTSGIEIKQADNTTLVQFDLHIADTILKVVDVIDWNENGKIEKILAYNG